MVGAALACWRARHRGFRTEEVRSPLRRVYLDHAATTPVHPEVGESISRCLAEFWGNPSSIHGFGREARRAMEEARAQVAELIGADTREILFTSGGTEADNLAVLGFARLRRSRGKHLITSQVEHHAVLDACRYLEREEGFRVTYLPVGSDGLVDPEDLRRALTPDTALVSVMLANNEVGTIQPVRELAAIAREHGAVVHTDAVQAAGQIPVDVNELGVDLLSLSAHKIYGPKGAGALYVRRGVRLEPLVHGGGQERRLRPGTENVPGIVGLGRAAAVARRELEARRGNAERLRTALIEGLFARIPDIILNGHGERRLPNNVNVSILGVDAESVLLNLDLKGVAASSGSACSAGSVEASHVLLAMGLDADQARSALRFSLGMMNTRDDVDYLLEVLPPIVERLRRMSPRGLSPTERA